MLEVRKQRLANLFERIESIPEDWLAGGKPGAGGTFQLEPLTCTSWKQLINSWRKALKWTEGLDYALSVVLAAAASVKLVGDQLWVKVISPPSTAKSILAEALAVDIRHVKSVSTFRGFYSGYQEDREGKGKNYSLIEQLDGKAFIIKDGDTLLTLPNRAQVLGQGRDLYDTVGRSQYNNKMSKDYHNKRFAWILMGTKSLRMLDASELGQRFLDCRIMDDIDLGLEKEIGWRKINQVRNNRYEVDGRPDTTDSKEMIEAKRLTGGYLSYLRSNMEDLYAGISMTDDAARRCVQCGEFIAYMRARPSKVQDEESAGRELSARLVSQIGKMALCLAVVLNRTSVDEFVMMRLKRITIDTSKGKTLRTVKKLHEAGWDGLTAEGLGIWEGETAVKERLLLAFMTGIGVTQRFKPPKDSGFSPKPRWRLTPVFNDLCDALLGVVNA